LQRRGAPLPLVLVVVVGFSRDTGETPITGLLQPNLPDPNRGRRTAMMTSTKNDDDEDYKHEDETNPTDFPEMNRPFSEAGYGRRKF
jgi:hypothetical protein